MSRELLLLVCLVGSLARANAAEPDALACLDQDMKRLVNSPSEGMVQVSRGWNADFAPFTPEGMTLVGTRRSEHFVTIVFKSPLSADVARSRLESAMTPSGWQPGPTPRSPWQSGGFRSPHVKNTIGSASTTFCHDDHGRLRATFAETAERTTYSTLLVTPASGIRCSETEAGSTARFEERFKAMPLLVYPEGATGSPAGGLSGGSDGLIAQIDLTVELDSAALLQHFSLQLEDQDWRKEGEWDGGRSSGSAWLSKAGAESGVLTIIEAGRDQYRALFLLVQHR